MSTNPGPRSKSLAILNNYIFINGVPLGIAINIGGGGEGGLAIGICMLNIDGNKRNNPMLLRSRNGTRC